MDRSAPPAPTPEGTISRRAVSRAMLAAAPALLAARRSEARDSLDLRGLDDMIAGWIKAGYYPGAGVIVGQGRQVLHRTVFGRTRTDTAVHVASAGKWVAAATIATQVDAGRLSWDTPVERHIPGFPDPLGRATLRQLLSHTSGFAAYQPETAPRDAYQTLAQSVAHILPMPPRHAPGQVFEYGGLAMQVAGRMAELAAGADFETLFQRSLGHRLGMSRSGFAPVSQEPGYSPMLGGGLHTTLDDYGRFLEMIAGRGRFRNQPILSVGAVAALEANQVGAARVAAGEFVEKARGQARQDVYGLGLWREEVAADGVATLISSPGWAGAYPWVDRSADIWGFVLAKVQGETAERDGFSTFLAGAAAPMLVRKALASRSAPRA